MAERTRGARKHTSLVGSGPKRVRIDKGSPLAIDDAAKLPSLGKQSSLNAFTEGPSARDQIKKHLSSRVENEKQFFVKAVGLGTTFMTAGLTVGVAGIVIGLPFWGGLLSSGNGGGGGGAGDETGDVRPAALLNLLSTLFELGGVALLLCGLVVLSACPYEVGKSGCAVPLSFDVEMRSNHGLWTASIVAAALYSLGLGWAAGGNEGWPSHAWWPAAAALPTVWALVKGRRLHLDDGVRPPFTDLWPEWRGAGDRSVVGSEACGDIGSLHEQAGRWGALSRLNEARPSALVAAFFVLTLAGRGGAQLGAGLGATGQWDSAYHVNLQRQGGGMVYCARGVGDRACAASLVAAGTFSVASAAFIAVMWLRFRFKDSAAREVSSPSRSQEAGATKALFSCGYAVIFCAAVDQVIVGLAGGGPGDWLRLLSAAIWLWPVLMVSPLVGVKAMRRTLRRWFESKEATNDGAFIAALLDSLIVPQNGVWFLWRDEPRMDYAENDHRRFWKKGNIRDVNADGTMKVSRRRSTMSLELPGGGSGGNALVKATSVREGRGGGNGGKQGDKQGTAAATVAGNANPARRRSAPVEGAEPKPKATGAAPAGVGGNFVAPTPHSAKTSKWSVLAESVKVKENSDTWLKAIKTGNKTEEVKIHHKEKHSSDELLKSAEENLRCIDWKNINLGLFIHSVRNIGKKEPKVNTFLLSRKLNPNEKIDFFISHSWSDCAHAKFACLEAVAKEFKAQNHGREPTFWLDKVCIDQEKITDGLKVLPINVTSSNRMLVLCGKSYPTRLWCVWELFTLCAFSSMDHVHKKIKFVPFNEMTKDEIAAWPDASGLGKPSDARMSRSSRDKSHLTLSTPDAAVENALLNFTLAKARCFDPNEENRLREIIEARGVEVFEGRIREAAAECLKSKTTQSDLIHSVTHSLKSFNLGASSGKAIAAASSLSVWKNSIAHERDGDEEGRPRHVRHGADSVVKRATIFFGGQRTPSGLAGVSEGDTEAKEETKEEGGDLETGDGVETALPKLSSSSSSAASASSAAAPQELATANYSSYAATDVRTPTVAKPALKSSASPSSAPKSGIKKASSGDSASSLPSPNKLGLPVTGGDAPAAEVEDLGALLVRVRLAHFAKGLSCVGIVDLETARDRQLCGAEVLTDIVGMTNLEARKLLSAVSPERLPVVPTPEKKLKMLSFSKPTPPPTPAMAEGVEKALPARAIMTTVEELFDLVDKNRDGRLTKAEVEAACGLLKMTPQEAGELFEELDVLGNGHLSRKELKRMESPGQTLPWTTTTTTTMTPLLRSDSQDKAQGSGSRPTEPSLAFPEKAVQVKKASASRVAFRDMEPESPAVVVVEDEEDEEDEEVGASLRRAASSPAYKESEWRGSFAGVMPDIMADIMPDLPDIEMPDRGSFTGLMSDMPDIGMPDMPDVVGKAAELGAWGASSISSVASSASSFAGSVSSATSFTAGMAVGFMGGVTFGDLGAFRKQPKAAPGSRPAEDDASAGDARSFV